MRCRIKIHISLEHHRIDGQSMLNALLEHPLQCDVGEPTVRTSAADATMAATEPHLLQDLAGHFIAYPQRWRECLPPLIDGDRLIGSSYRCAQSSVQKPVLHGIHASEHAWHAKSPYRVPHSDHGDLHRTVPVVRRQIRFGYSALRRPRLHAIRVKTIFDRIIR